MSAHRLTLLVVLAGTWSLLSCSRSERRAAGTEPAPAPAPAPELTASCAPVAVLAGGDPATCSAELRNASDDVRWTLTGPGALSASTGPSVRYLPPAQLDAVAVVHLIAAAAGVAAAVDLEVAPPLAPAGVTVSGRVVDVDGNAVEAVGVAVPGLPETATAADGTFTLSGVEAPYDLILFTEGEERAATVYTGLTRTDPTVALYQRWASTAAPRAARVAARVTGGNPGATARTGDHQGLLVAPRRGPAIDPPFAWGGDLRPPPSTWSGPLSWRGAETLDAAALAVQWRVDPGTDAPVAYWLATLGLTLTDGATVRIPDLALASVPVVMTQGQVRLPPGQALRRVSTQLAPDPAGPAFPLFTDDREEGAWGDPPGFAYVLPDLATGVVRLCVRTVGTAPGHTDEVAMACVDATGQESVELAPHAPPTAVSPPSGANSVGPDTVFVWRPVEGGVYAVEVVPEAEDAPAFLIFTAERRARLPALGKAELTPPSGAAYAWRVRSFAPIAAVDELATPGRTPLALDYPSPDGVRWTWGRSSTLHFLAR